MTPPPDELIEEILLRLRPDEPSCLLRASLVCKPWRRIISHRRFRRRLHELHGRPPVLGFLRNNRQAVEDFVATTSSAFSLAVTGDWRALDFRHGRALLLDMVPGWGELIIWDPITGDQERMPVPEAMWHNTFQGDHPTAAIVCAAPGCDHRGCHGKRPFQLVMLYSDTVTIDYQEQDLEWVTWARSYSSETGQWSDVSWIQEAALDFRMHTTSMLVGDSMLYFLSDQGTLIQYDLTELDATAISPPLGELEFEGNHSVTLILTDDGGLGVAECFSDSHLNIWSRVVSDGIDPAVWVKSRVIYLENLFPAATLGEEEEEVRPMCFAERANVLFIRKDARIFTIELPSERVRKVCEDDYSCSLVPIEGFYIPHVSEGEQA